MVWNPSIPTETPTLIACSLGVCPTPDAPPGQNPSSPHSRHHQDHHGYLGFLLLSYPRSDLLNACKAQLQSPGAKHLNQFALLPDPTHCSPTSLAPFLCTLSLYFFRGSLIFSSCLKVQRFNTRDLCSPVTFWAFAAFLCTVLKLSSTFFLAMVSLWHICCLVYTTSSVCKVYILEYSGLVKLCFLPIMNTKGPKHSKKHPLGLAREGLLLPANFVQYQLPGVWNSS